MKKQRSFGDCLIKILYGVSLLVCLVKLAAATVKLKVFCKISRNQPTGLFCDDSNWHVSILK